MSDFNRYDFEGNVNSLSILTDDHQTVQIFVEEQYWRPENREQEFEALQRWIDGAALIGFVPGPHNLTGGTKPVAKEEPPPTPASEMGI